jgi:hypothetical protein
MTTMTTTTTRQPVRAGEGASSEPRPQDGVQIAALEGASARTLVERLDGLGKAMRAHPVLAVGVGIAAGYLLARLQHRG